MSIHKLLQAKLDQDYRPHLASFTVHARASCNVPLDAGNTGVPGDLIFVAAGRAGDAEGSDNLISGLDGDATGERRDVGQRREHCTVNGCLAASDANALDASNRKIEPRVTTV